MKKKIQIRLSVLILFLIAFVTPVVFISLMPLDMLEDIDIKLFITKITVMGTFLFIIMETIFNYKNNKIHIKFEKFLNIKSKKTVTAIVYLVVFLSTIICFISVYDIYKIIY